MRWTMAASATDGRGGRIGVALPVVLVLLAVGGLAFYLRGGRQTAEISEKIATKQAAAHQPVSSAAPTWARVGRVNAGMREPAGIALDPDASLYVVGDAGVRVFSADGSARAAFRVAGKPRCVAVGGAGLVYLGVGDHVEVYGADGKPRAVWASAGKGGAVTSIALAGDDVWVADAGRRLVDCYNREGRVLRTIGKRDDARHIPGLTTPSLHLDVAAAPGGLVAVSNPGRLRVETYTRAGDLSESWGRASQDTDGFCGCCNPTDVAVFGDGKIATSEKGLTRVKVYQPDGTLESVVVEAPEISPTAAGIDLVADARGQLWVLDPVARSVSVYARRK